MAVTPARTRAGWRKIRALDRGDRVAIVAPASPLRHAAADHFDAGVAELRRLGFEPVWEARVLDRAGYLAGAATARADELRRAWARPDVAALVGLRGGYGSVQVLPGLHELPLPPAPAGLVGYSDLTSLHIYLGCIAGVVSVHGPMIDGRIARGPDAYDVASFLGALSDAPLGELAPDGVDVLRDGEAAGPLVGGTLTQLLASLATPYAFRPPAGCVLFIDEVGERPYRLDRMLTQVRLAGLLASAAAVVFGELPRCDEPDGAVTARAVAADVLSDFPGPILFGFPSGHTSRATITLPFGVHTRVVARGPSPRLVIEEAAATRQKRRITS